MSFSGFSWPQKNWFRLPNEWTDITSRISSLAELKVVEYVLRHTWGFREPDISKRITTKEFMFGRRKKGGGTIDEGTGLSNKSVYLGLKSGVKHGFLLVEIDDSNKSNIKKYYRLKMEPDTNNVHSRCVQSTEPLRQKVVPYIERHYERNLESSMSKLSSSDGECSFPSSDGRKGKRTATPFDYKATAELHKVVSSHIKVNCTANNKQWANQFRLMRTSDKVPKKDIRAAIEWYRDNIGSEYMVEAFSAGTFRKKYMNSQIPAAMKRNGYNNTSNPDDPRTETQRTVDRVLEYLRKDGTWAEGDYFNPPDQPDVDRALVALGKRKGEISSGDCMN